MKAYSEILLYEKNRKRAKYYRLTVKNGNLVIEDADTNEPIEIDVDRFVLRDGTTAIDYTTGSQQIGDVTGGNYTEIESDGTIHSVGDALCWDDTFASAGVFRLGASSLTLDTLEDTIKQFRFDLNDEIFIPGIQFPHKMATGLVVSPHIHLINQNAIGATNYNVRFEFEWDWVNIGEELQGSTTADVTFSLQNESALHHSVFEFGDITPTSKQGGISSIFIARVKRISAASNAYNTNDIFTVGIDIHFRIDTMGSRDEYVK